MPVLEGLIVDSDNLPKIQGVYSYERQYFS